MTTAEVKEKVAAAASKAAQKSLTVKGKDQPTAWRGRSKDRAKKFMPYGKPGTGKTFLLSAPLSLGLKVLVLSADLGGNGMDSVINTLVKSGVSDQQLDEQLVGFDFSEYDPMALFLEDPTANKDMAALLKSDWVPDVVALDGFSTFQIDNADEKVLTEYSSKEMKDNEMREDGLVASTQDWQAIKRATIRPLRKFIAMKFVDKNPHKVITLLEDIVLRGDDDRKNKKDPRKLDPQVVKSLVLKIQPKLHGSSKDLLEAAPDILVRCFVDGDGFKYTVNDDTGKITAKSRGYDFPVGGFPADPLELWNKVIG